MLLKVLAGLLIASADTTGGGWTAIRNNLDIYPDFGARTVRVHGQLTLRLDNASSTGPSLRLGHDLAPFFKTQAQFMEFTSAASRGAETHLNRPGEMRGVVYADVRFPDAVRRGANVTVDYDAVMVKPSFEFVVTDSVAMGADGMGWYARPAVTGGKWLPTIDPTPGLTRVHLPSGWYSLATGAFVSRKKEGANWVETWRQNISRARSFVAGPYKLSSRKIGKMEVRMYGLTQAMNPDTLVNNVSSIISTLSQRYGPYPYSKYAAAEFPDSAVRWWGDALADFQVLRTSLLQSTHGGFSALAHEIGHAWWGNLVSPAWPGGYMLNEAMANYSTMLALEGLYGKARYQRSLIVDESGGPPDYTIANYFKMVADGKDIPLSQMKQGGLEYEIAQIKGPRVYHMLRREVGDKVFFATLQKLVSSHSGRILSLDEMRTAFVAAAPGKNMKQFFEQWLDRTGAPVFAVELTCSGTGDKKVNHVKLTQTQPGPAYVLSLPIVLKFAGDSIQRSIHIGSKDVTETIPANRCYSSVDLDTEQNVFIWRPEYGS